MFTLAAIFRPIDLFDPSTEIVLAYLFVLAVGLIVVKVLLRKKYHALIDQLPADEAPHETMTPPKEDFHPKP